MSVEIEPQELGFSRPFTQEVSQILKIRNTGRQPLAFKVKTTAPKQYCVRPNSGRVEPGKHIEVTVLLQAMKVEPPPDAKCKDKFLVQSVPISPEHEFSSAGSVWQDDVDKSLIQEKKIRVFYLPGEGSTIAATPVKSGVNGGARDPAETAPPAYRSPSPEEHYTPDTRRSTGAAQSIKSDNDSSSRATATAKDTASSVAAAVPTYEELKSKLAEAQATIANYGQDAGLRLRKVAKGETDNATVNDIANRVQQGQGVPLQIVAILCLLSFLLAYIFF